MNDETMESGQSQGKGLAIASLICGIGAFIPGIIIGCIGIPAAILAIIFGAVSRKRGAGGMATAGIALGIIYLIVAVILFFFLKDEQTNFMSDTQGDKVSDTNRGDGDGGGGDFGADPNDGPDGND